MRLPLPVKLRASNWLGILTGLLLLAPASPAAEFANIEYLCCDWGPAMTLSGKTNEPPQFSESENEIYFLKQLGAYTKTPTGTQGHGINIYLCKMKADGTGKTELRELWHQPVYPIDTQTQSTWMSINQKTHKIALSVTLAGSDITGLWTMNLDGLDLQHTITPSLIEGHRQSINFPSWTPDGQWIVFSESLRGAKRGRIRKCDGEGRNLVYLTDGTTDGQPCISPDGKQIVYIHGINWATLLWLMDFDGKNQHALLDLNGKPHGGLWPTWSPDSKRIVNSERVIDAVSGKTLYAKMPTRDGERYTYGWCHWGREGLVGYTVAGLVLTDSDIKECKMLGESRGFECDRSEKDSCRW